MELKVEGSDLQKMLESAVVTALGEAGRDALVKNVVEYLTTPPRSGYGEASPLMRALQTAANQAAHTYFRERLASDEAFQKMFDDLYTEVVKKMMNAETREKLVEKMTSKLSDAFESRY